MVVDSYLELFTTLYGWMLYNLLYDVLVNTGLVFIPLMFLVIGYWKDASTNSKGTPAAELSVKNILWDTVIIMMVAAIFFVPSIPVAPSQVQYSPLSPEDGSPGTTVSAANSGTSYDQTIGSISTAEPRLPMWWLLLHKIVSGINHSIIGSLPSRTDIDVARQRLAAANIQDPKLAHQLPAFISSCFNPARNKFSKYSRNNAVPPPGEALLAEHGGSEVDWIGSRVLLGTPGMYAPCHDVNLCGDTLTADYPIRGLPDGEDTHCNVWWGSLRTDLLAQSEPTLWDALKDNAKSLAGVSEEELEDARIQAVLNGYTRSTLQLDGGNIEYHGEQGVVDTAAGGISHLMKSFFGEWGATVESAKASTKMHVVKLALPMVQALLLMTVYMFLPVFIVFGRFEIGSMVTLSFVLFTIKFLTAIWAIAGWVEFSLYDALYPNGTLLGALVSFGNEEEFIRNRVLSVCTASLWLLMPAVFFYGLVWVGVKGGGGISGALGEGRGPADQAGGGSVEAIEQATKAATKVGKGK
ncbi:MAG: conjugal transfer protein TraG N-terminal domain-containing protein [Gammaproteobacteria bacterium]|nr:conjugal transfer protein TraG N-terminal domain-containing protein [Gammaproteobacteria bacterium]